MIVQSTTEHMWTSLASRLDASFTIADHDNPEVDIKLSSPMM